MWVHGGLVRGRTLGLLALMSLLGCGVLTYNGVLQSAASSYWHARCHSSFAGPNEAQEAGVKLRLVSQLHLTGPPTTPNNSPCRSSQQYAVPASEWRRPCCVDSTSLVKHHCTVGGKFDISATAMSTVTARYSPARDSSDMKRTGYWLPVNGVEAGCQRLAGVHTLTVIHSALAASR